MARVGVRFWNGTLPPGSASSRPAEATCMAAGYRSCMFQRCSYKAAAIRAPSRVTWKRFAGHCRTRRFGYSMPRATARIASPRRQSSVPAWRRSSWTQRSVEYTECNMPVRFVLAFSIATGVLAQQDPMDLLRQVQAKVAGSLNRLPRYMCTQTIDRARYEPDVYH